jgi:protein-disulfide isomerase
MLVTPVVPPKWRQILDALVSLSIVIACGAVTWSLLSGSGGRLASPTAAVPRFGPAGPKSAQQPLPAQPVSLAGAATRGSTAAKIAIIEYSDFQCPYCSKFATEVFPRIDKAFVQTGQVLVAFRQLPLEAIHPFAMKAAEASECAAREGKFWEMHDRLFETPKTLDEDSVRKYALAIGLQSSAFDRCLKGDRTAKIRADLQAAKVLGIEGTPSFLIGRLGPGGEVEVKVRLNGAQPFERFKAEIDKLAMPGPATVARAR